MTQFTLPVIDPASNTGTDLSSFLNSWRPALESSHSGAVRPTYAVRGMIWYDTDINRPFFYNGTQDVGFALSTDSAAYLPLTGGNLSGALGGTSAQFNSTVAVGGTLIPGMMFSVRGAGQFNGTLSVGGAAIGTSTLAVGGNVSVLGAINLTGNLTGGHVNVSSGNISGDVTAASFTTPNHIVFNGQPFRASKDDNNTIAIYVNEVARVVPSMVGYDAQTFLGGGPTGLQLNINAGSTSANFHADVVCDAALKENIKPATIDVGKIIDSIEIVQFDWKPEQRKRMGVDRESLGFVAQNVKKAIPRAATKTKIDDVEYDSLHTAMLIPYLLREIQLLRQRVQTLEKGA